MRIPYAAARMTAKVRVSYELDGEDEIADWLRRRAQEQRMSTNMFARHQLVRIYLNETRSTNGKAA